MNRRQLLLGGIAATVAGGYFMFGFKSDANDGAFEITKTEAEWRKILTPEQFYILREAGTEPPGSSPLLNEKRNGNFHCAGCDLALFDSKTKYESGTGWPSFFDTIPDAVAYSTDYKLIIPRTEEHCARCGGHLGHVFSDGPAPTGKRHCINGLALTFKPATA